ncbi:RagB/SusD family nutrient uptake outer membrane protein [Pedobacter sp. PWIIR3]
MKRTYYILAVLLILSISSCKKFLDVQPKTQVESDALFEDEKGYQQALTGLYVKLTDKSLYGKELTYGMLDVLAFQYTRITGPYVNMQNYNYQSDSVRTRTTAIWKQLYNGISNANNLLKNLDRTDLPQFTGVNFNIIKGEALGLRAFMHFDLLRLYAPAPASAGGMDAVAIPYANKFGIESNPRLTVSAVIAQVQTDLAAAAVLLKSSDPVVAGNPAATNYLRDRFYKFNYYAVKALQARVYLYAGDKANALICAEEVINGRAFPFAANNNIVNGYDKVYNSELIFALNMYDLHTYTANYFVPGSSAQLAKTDAQYTSDFDAVTSDYRFVYLSTATPDFLRYSTKYAPVAGTTVNYLYKMPVIRISEMYYIAAECLSTIDKTRSVGYLNAVRRARNQTADVSATVSDAELQNQIFREYRREFIAEGQLFYYYKRLNKSAIEYSTVAGSNSVYVLPIPDDEIKYGN